MRPLLTASILVATLAGCTVTHPIARPATSAELGALVGPKRTHIALLQQRPGGLVSLPVPPSLAPVAIPFPDDQAAAGQGVDLASLRGYEVTRRGRGALEGLGVGIVTGFFAGAVFGAAAGDDRPCPASSDVPCIRFSSGDLALLFGAVGAFAGAGVGALTGLLVAHTDRYTFTDTPPSP